MTSSSGTNPLIENYARRQAIRFAWFVGLTLTTMLASCSTVQFAVASTSSYEHLLANLQSQDMRSLEFPSGPLRKSIAETFLADCKVAAAHVPWQAPTEGFTEEGPSDISAMRREFARWRLTEIFGDCAGLTQEILAAKDVRQEIRAWIRLTRLLADEQIIRNLIETAEIRSPPHDGTGENAIEISQWRALRNVIFEAMLKFMDKP
jgi:hypothetical protein